MVRNGPQVTRKALTLYTLHSFSCLLNPFIMTSFSWTHHFFLSFFSSLLSPFHSDLCTSPSSVAPLLLIFASPFSPGCFFQVFLSLPFELTHLKFLRVFILVFELSLLLLHSCYLWLLAQFPFHYITRLHLKACSSFLCIHFCKLSSCCPLPIFGRSWGLSCCKALGN